MSLGQSLERDATHVTLLQVTTSGIVEWPSLALHSVPQSVEANAKQRPGLKKMKRSPPSRTSTDSSASFSSRSRTSSSDSERSWRRRQRREQKKRKSRRKRRRRRRQSSDDSDRSSHSEDSSTTQLARGKSAARSARKGSESSFHEPEDEDTLMAEGLIAPPDGKPVVAPAPGKTSFSSWEALQTYLQSYCEATHQMFPVAGSRSVEAANVTREASIDEGFDGYDDEDFLASVRDRSVVPDHFEHYSKVFRCTHHGKPRPRGNKIRPNQFYRASGCKAKINACVQFDKERRKWRVNFTTFNVAHNHYLTPELYASYAKNRKVKKKKTLDTVEALWKHGAPRKGILEFITSSTDLATTMKDVHNMCAELKAKKHAQYPTVESRVKLFLKDFCVAKNHVGRVFVDDDKIARCVTIQTAHMRSIFDKFPEVMLIDSTHNTNKARYKLFSFMVQDSLGNGQHVQHALITDERAATLKMACAQFKKANPSWVNIRCIVMDKDFTEMAVIEEEFPEAKILLCQWHVMHYLELEVVKAKHGLDEWQRKNMKIVLKELINARSEALYEKKIAFMKSILGTEDKINAWFDYFTPNWDSCRDKWSV